MPKIGEFLFGKKEKQQQMPLFTPEQQDFLKMILQGTQPGMQSGMDYLNQIMSGDEDAFSQFEAPYKRQFDEEIMPEIATRFAGTPGGLGSSAFGQSLSSAGAGLTENLAALRESLKMQAINHLSGLSSIGLGQQYENTVTPGTGGLFGGMSSGMGSAVGGMGANAMRGLYNPASRQVPMFAN